MGGATHLVSVSWEPSHFLAEHSGNPHVVSSDYLTIHKGDHVRWLDEQDGWVKVEVTGEQCGNIIHNGWVPPTALVPFASQVEETEVMNISVHWAFNGELLGLWSFRPSDSIADLQQAAEAEADISLPDEQILLLRGDQVLIGA